MALLSSLMTLMACGTSQTGTEGKSQSFVMGTRVHRLPLLSDSTIQTGSAPAGAHLNYYGGHVISNVKVVKVLYGQGTYQPFITAAPNGGNSMADFFTGITNSPYFDMMSEYNTNITAQNGAPGTNQTIGRGTYAGSVQITPSSSNSGSSITDAQIQAEINAQISSGALPAPDANTIYFTYFPSGVTINQGSSGSCVSGGFCAYHGTFTRNGASTYYAVMPDMSPGSGCDTGCGTGTPFANESSVSSHELMEAVSDGEVGLSTTVGPPLAWYDPTNGENGDICNAQQGTILGGDGHTYTVQKEFSNLANDCIVSRGTTPPPPSNDFSISASPSSITGSGSSSISTAVASGSAATVNLTVSGAPSGASVSLSPTSVTAGGSSTLTVNAGSAAAGNYTLTVTGTEGTATHATTVTLTIGSPPPPPPPSALTNGGFETGDTSGWSSSGTTAAVSGGHSGSFAAQVGATGPSTDSSLSQTFTAGTSDTSLSFFYKVVCPDSVQYDWASATLKDNTAGTTATVLANTCSNSGAWVKATAAVTGGHSYTLTLSNHDDNYAGDPTFTLFDDVTLGGGTPPPPPPPPGGGITNGGFESGSFTGWSVTGTTSIVGGAHGGSSAAQAGASSATNGDSNISQTFTVPAGKSQLSAWYNNSCPDTVQYDWATITLKDNTAGSTSTMLAKTCTTAGWNNVTASVTAGHSYTITLTNHDDNYSGDPTFTLFDDVTLN